jgi:hypothetical protein
MTTGDFNGDGRLDLAVADFDSDKVSILLGNGDGTFPTHADYAILKPASSVLAADFNEDGKLDLAVSTSSNVTSILLGNGDGTFQTHVDYAGGCESPPGGCEPTTADLNGDGKLDLAIPNLTNPTVSVLFGNGDATFQTPSNFAVASPNNFVVTGDFNEDGRLDLVVEDRAGGYHTVSVLLQGTTVNQNCLQPPLGLVSWWSGDKTANDVQGTNPGELLGGASYKRGMVGPGFRFDGVNDWVRIPNSPSLSQTRITLDAWVYVTGKQGTHRHIISKDDVFREREYSRAVFETDVFACFVQLPSGLALLIGTTPVELDSWYHVAMTHDGLKLRLYLNGVLEGTLDAVGDVVPTQNPVGIGGNMVAAVFFPGIIDEAQIFNRALTDAEILAIYQAGAAGQCKPEIFVSSITPSYEVVGHGFLVSTSVVIQDENGIGIENASVQIKTILPSGSVLVFRVTTDATGEAVISFVASETGLYRFTVRKVSHPGREYDRSLNIETTDTLVIP